MEREPCGCSTPPDFWAKFGQKEIAIEVTQIGNLLAGDRKQDPYFSKSLEKAYENDLKKNGRWVRKGDFILLNYKSKIPLKKRSDFAKKLLIYIKYLYPLLKNQKKFILDLSAHTERNKIECVTLEMSKFNQSESELDEDYYPIKEMFPPCPIDLVPLSKKTECVVKYIAGKKGKKFAEIKIPKDVVGLRREKCAKMEMPKWLVLINTYGPPFYEDYKNSFLENADLLKTQVFEKFYFIEVEDGTIENDKCLEL